MSICTLCKAQIPESSPEGWTTPDRQLVHVDRSAVPSAVVETSVGKFEICESCYQHRLPSYFTRRDLAEIVHRFGLEYRDRGDLQRCIESLTRARLNATLKVSTVAILKTKLMVNLCQVSL